MCAPPPSLTRGRTIARVSLVRRATSAISFALLLALAAHCVCQAAQSVSPGPSACHEDMAGQASEAQWMPSPGSLCCCSASDQATILTVASHRALPEVVAAGAAALGAPQAEFSVESVGRFAYHLHDPPATPVLVLRL